MKLSLSKLINISITLIVVGIISSLVSMGIIIYGNLIKDYNKYSAAGEISSALANIFGLMIASIALIAYINREEIGQNLSDKAWESKEKLEQAFHQFAAIMQYANNNPKNKNFMDDFDILIHPTLKYLNQSLKTAKNSDLYQALWSDYIPSNKGQELKVGLLILLLNYEIDYQLNKKENIDLNLLLLFANKIIVALREINKENIYILVHDSLKKNFTNDKQQLQDPIDFLNTYDITVQKFKS
ncbi:MAG: hypothetical protein QM539_04540 [Alphaproteobacteria bacterium]|nr:hypothetical protein [Alphaproteobacteria bacterium]